MTHVAVIGVGVIGAATVFRLAQAGHSKGPIAAEILHGREAAELVPFRPDRSSQSGRPRRRMDGLR